MIGPSQLAHLPNSTLLIGIGLFIGGCTRNITGAYLLVEAIRGGVIEYSNQEERVSDMISSIYMSGEGLTLLLFPIIGKWLIGDCGFQAHS